MQNNYLAVLSMEYVSCVHLYTVIGTWVVFFSSYFLVIRNHLLQLHLLTSGAGKKAPGLEKLLFVIFCINSRIKYLSISFLGKHCSGEHGEHTREYA